jgi:aldehyde dehydrogenase (NAD+)
VFEDAPIDQAVEGIINGIYFNQGHVCCAGSRLLVQESIEPVVRRKLEHRIATLRLGDPLDKNTDVGAINSQAQLLKIRELVRSGVEEGAELHQSGCAIPVKGFWFPPTFFTGVAQSHRIANEEIFGPVLAVMTFRTPEEAVEKANNTRTVSRRASGPTRGRRSSRSRRGCGPVSCGRTPSTSSTRHPPSAATRSPGSAARAGVHGLRAYVELS